MSVSIAQGVVATAPKQIVAGTNITTSETDTTITINSSGGGGGAATQKQVILDFGSVPSYSKAIVFTDVDITPTSKVVMTAHAESDELEMDGFVCSAQCGSGTATAYIHAVPGPVTGQRKFNYLIG